MSKETKKRSNVKSRKTATHYKLDNRPISLSEVYELSKYDEDFYGARMFSCDITEARIAGGMTTRVGSPALLFGINTVNDILYKKTYTVTPDEFGRRDSLRLFESGIMRLGFGKWPSSPISFQESLKRSEQAKHLRNHVAVLVTSEDRGNPYVVVSALYYRVLLRQPSSRNHKARWEPIWLLYSENKKNPCLSHKDARVLLEELNEDRCIHRFETFCHTGWKTIHEVTERCAFCDEERMRKPTKAEQTANAKGLKQFDKLHAVYHKVCKRLEGLDGYEAIKQAEKLAKRHKNHVQFVGCDDDSHSSSALLLVDHESNDHYMGTSVIYLPQNSGTRAVFFLYPEARKRLATALEIVKRKTDVCGEEPSL